MDEKKPKPGRGPDTGPGGLRAPAKGDSAPSEVPLDGMTFIEPPKPPAKPPTKPPTKPPADPGATVVNANLTLDGSGRTQGSFGGRSTAGMYREIVLQSGDILGGRYEILDLLGEGGMGAVYKAQDRETDRFIALKLIRPELASNPAILARFKQELLTAHQVTHKNVIRIYDIAEADGVKFITMEYVEGHDLRRFLLDDGRLPPEKAVEIVRQICLALDAAHSAGIIHRDLKPQNVMMDKQGRILVMDFGLARSVDSEGMTQTGALLGTIEYMSPEQAMGKPLDQRSDIFALGLIFYELLTGKMPYKAETAMASLLKRNQDRAIPAVEVDATIPKGLSDIVAKCLERELDVRYQSANEILADLDAWEGKRPVTASIIAPPPKKPIPWKWVAPGALAVVLVASGVAFKDRIFKSTPAAPTVAGPQLSLAILPFSNASNDASLDGLGGTLSDTLSTAVGQSAHMRTVSPNRLHQIFSDLQIAPNAVIDSDIIRNVIQQTNADTVVYGKYSKSGNQIRIDATLQDTKHNSQKQMSIDAASEQEIPAKIDELAAMIRKNLALSSDVMNELKSSSFQPSSKSVEALKFYNQGVQLVREGRSLEADRVLNSSIAADPQFALAYAWLAEIKSELGSDGEAERNSRKAVELAQQLPASEKYMIEANHARILKDVKKATDAYENLAKMLPGNIDVEYVLGRLYSDKGDYAKAKTKFSGILQSDPNNIPALWGLGVAEIFVDNPRAALEPLTRGLNQATQADNGEERALILQAMGIAYSEMNKPAEAMRNYQDSMEISKGLGLKRLLANSLSGVAQVQTTIGKTDAALASYTQALQILHEIGAKKDYGDVLNNRGSLYTGRGDYDKALVDFKDSLQIQRDAEDLSYQAVCLANIGTVYLDKGDTDNALTYTQQALELREKLDAPDYLAAALTAIADVYTATGDYNKALTSLLRSLDISRKANNTKESAAVSDQIGNVYTYQGHIGRAVGASQDAVKGYRTANDYSSEMIDALRNLASALALAGRGDESGVLLDEAQKMAADLKNETVVGELLNTRGDVAFYRGDMKAARSAYEQAAKIAAKTKEKDLALIAKMNLARVALAEGRSQAAITDLRSAVQQADAMHMKYFSLRSSVDMAAAMVNLKDYAHARTELESALSASEKLGLRLETARIHYLLGRISQLSGNGSEASGQYQQAVSLLNEIKGEPGAEKLLQRPDLKIVYDDSTSGSRSAKS